MPSTPTTEGSIVAYLRADNGDLNRGIDEAKAKVAALTGTDTTVHVKADVASAVAKLDAVEAAERRVAAANIKYAAAADLATSAADRQWRVNQKLSVSEDAKQRATDASTRATAKADLASLELTASENALAAAKRKVAEASLAEAAAEDGAAASSDKAAKSNQTTISRMGLIIAAVAVLVPMIAPLSGYVVGVSGALAGMGAAGILAIVGIRNEIAAGTAQGAAWSQGLQVLKGDLSELAGTAAAGLMSSFNTAVQSINRAMPQLNSQIGQFSQMLGVVGNSVLNGVINAFRILNPLFQASGQYIEGIAAGFQSWTQNGGLQQFASYAMANLPMVEQTLGSLASAIMHILAALAPLGTFGLGVIKTVSDVINAIPVNMLTALAVGGTAAFVAFKSWAILGPILEATAAGLGAVGVAADIAAGPVGWIIGAVALVAATFTAATMATQQSTAAQDSYTAALTASHGALDQGVRDQAAKNLQDSGALALAKQLGVSYSTVTSAVLGNADAMKILQTQVSGSKLSDSEYIARAQKAGMSSTDWTLKAGELTDKVKAQTKNIKDSAQSIRDQAAAAGGAGSAAQLQATYIGITAGTYQTLTSQVDAATQASKNWKTEQDLVNGIAQSVEQANITLSQSYTTMASTIAANIKSTNRAAATSMDINTQYGAQNHQLILNQVTDAEGLAAAKVAADLKAGKSQAQAAADGNAILATQKQKIEDQAVAAGLSRAAVHLLLSQIDQLKPKDITVSVETAAALAKVAELDRVLSELNLKTSGSQSQKQNRTAIGRASGGLIPEYHAAGGAIASYLASGGSPFAPRGTDTVPLMATPGEFMVKRSSAQYAPQFIAAYNDNPKKALQSVASPQQPVINNYFSITANDPEQLFQGVMNHTNMRAAV